MHELVCHFDLAACVEWFVLSHSLNQHGSCLVQQLLIIQILWPALELDDAIGCVNIEGRFHCWIISNTIFIFHVCQTEDVGHGICVEPNFPILWDHINLSDFGCACICCEQQWFTVFLDFFDKSWIAKNICSDLSIKQYSLFHLVCKQLYAASGLLATHPWSSCICHRQSNRWLFRSCRWLCLH